MGLIENKSNKPWGYFEVLFSDNKFKVKHIYINVGGSISLQLHNHRSEHWVIIEGSAHIICGDDEYYLYEGHSIDIPVLTKHRLTNNGKIPLRVVETQFGSYLEEDDIVRFEDVYGRVTI